MRCHAEAKPRNLALIRPTAFEIRGRASKPEVLFFIDNKIPIDNIAACLLILPAKPRSRQGYHSKTSVFHHSSLQYRLLQYRLLKNPLSSNRLQ